MPSTHRYALLIAAGVAAFILPSLMLAHPASAGQPAAGSPVTFEQACPAPALDHITCDAQLLVSARSGRPIRPKIKHSHAKPASTVTGQAAPQPQTPAYLQQAYDLTYLSTTRAIGDTVAVVGIYNDPTAAADLNTFRSTYDLPACTVASGCFRQLNEQGQPAPLPAPDSDWSQEESMDIEAVSSICPNCRIDLVEAGNADAQDLQAAITAAIAAGANKVSISGDGIYEQSPFTDFSAPGVSIVAATGDNGVLPVGEDAYPAALPYVTAVGGTSLEPASAADPTLRGVSESAWSSTGAGCDMTEQPLQYQPATGCNGRMYADVSADADPNTGLTIYDSAAGGWFYGGGTSLAAPLVAAFEAVTGVDGSTPQWAYADAANLNHATGGSTGGCAGELSILCSGGPAYNGPTGAGSISGQIVTGAPGIGLPSFGSAPNRTYARHVSYTSASLQGGVYPNGLVTSYHWQYGTTKTYGSRTRSVSAGAGTAPVAARAQLMALRPHTTYHCRLVARNASGTVYGYDTSFTTQDPAAAPVHAHRAPHHRRRRSPRSR